MTNKRLIKFENLKDDPWFKRIYSRLSKPDLELARGFLAKHATLSSDEFEFKLNRLFLDIEAKPKRWLEITELLMISNGE